MEYISRDHYDGCMLARNRRLADAAGLLLAVCNVALRSGTGASEMNLALGRRVLYNIFRLPLSRRHDIKNHSAGREGSS